MCEPVAELSKALPTHFIICTIIHAFLARIQIKVDQYFLYVLNQYRALHMGIH